MKRYGIFFLVLLSANCSFSQKIDGEIRTSLREFLVRNSYTSENRLSINDNINIYSVLPDGDMLTSDTITQLKNGVYVFYQTCSHPVKHHLIAFGDDIYILNMSRPLSVIMEETDTLLNYYHLNNNEKDSIREIISKTHFRNWKYAAGEKTVDWDFYLLTGNTLESEYNPEKSFPKWMTYTLRYQTFKTSSHQDSLTYTVFNLALSDSIEIWENLFIEDICSKNCTFISIDNSIVLEINGQRGLFWGGDTIGIWNIFNVPFTINWETTPYNDNGELVWGFEFVALNDENDTMTDEPTYNWESHGLQYYYFTFSEHILAIRNGIDELFIKDGKNSIFKIGN